MKTVKINSFASKTSLDIKADTEIPVPIENQVLIKVKSASINSIDWVMCEGYLQALLNQTMPLALGWDFSGEVVAIGDRAGNLMVGDEVYSYPNMTKHGSYAEYICIDENEVSVKPKLLTWQEAAGLPYAALAAWQSLFDIAKLELGQKVLILSESGTVSQFAIQLAKLSGAYVYATAFSKNKELVLDLGADEVIDYQKGCFSELKGIDVVFDTIGGEIQTDSLKTLNVGGCLVSIVQDPNEGLAVENGTEGVFCFVQPNAAQLEKLAEFVDAGQLNVFIDSEFSLDDADQAHVRSESGCAQGKVIINIST